MKSILIVDDELEICKSIKMILEYEDYYVEFTTDADQGLEKLRHTSFDAMLLDIQMPDKNGFEILDDIQKNNYQITVIMISAFSSLENAVKATKLGAFDFIEKPIDRDKLLISIRNAVNQNNLLKENKKLKSDLSVDNLIIGESDALSAIMNTVARVAKTDTRVLITGENGTGKELIARAIHEKSERAEKSLVDVNCAAIPSELIESELFGHVKGSFTGAVQDRVGKFEQADSGTLFLDEIGDMSLQAQAKVLRAIEDGKITKVGDTEKISVDVRIVAATNKDLQKEIKDGNFREDLYHRLNVIPLHVPPLRERKSDIPLLVNHFSDMICEKNKFPKKIYADDAIEALKNQRWTGNIRELKNLVERIVIMIPDENVKYSHISSFLPRSTGNNSEFFEISNNFQEFKELAEKTFIKKQLDANDWNISKTAEILDIQRSHLYTKMKKYNIEKGS